MKLVWDESARDDYVWWQQQERKVLKRINTVITDIQRKGNGGIGKPEPLKHGFQGYWSRRITDEHRLVYKVVDDEIRIAACRYHYERLPKPYSALCGFNDIFSARAAEARSGARQDASRLW